MLLCVKSSPSERRVELNANATTLMLKLMTTAENFNLHAVLYLASPTTQPLLILYVMLCDGDDEEDDSKWR